MKDKYNFLISNTVLFFISTFSSKFLTFILMPIYTAHLLPSEYSVVDLMTQTANLLIPLVSLGVPNSIIRFGLDKKYSKKGVFTVAALCYAVGYGVLWLFYPIISKITFIGTYIKFLYLYLLFSCLRTLVQQFARAKVYTRLYAIDGIMATVNTLLFVYIYLVKMNLGAMGYIGAIITADAISFLFISLISGCWKSFSFKHLDKSLAKEMLTFCIPLIPTSVFWWVTNASDHYLVAWMVGEAAAGIYAVSYKIPSIVNLFSTVFTEAWQISAVQEGSEENSDEFFSNVFKAYQSVVFMAAAGLILICRPLISFMVAEKYYDAWQFIPVLIMATVFSCFSAFLSSIYMVDKNGKANLFTMMAGALSNICMNLIMIPRWGAQGAAIATFVSYVIVFLLRALTTKKVIDIHISPVYMLTNVCLVLALSVAMVGEIKYFIPICIALTLRVIALNIKPFIDFALMVLRGIKKKRA